MKQKTHLLCLLQLLLPPLGDPPGHHPRPDPLSHRGVAGEGHGPSLLLWRLLAVAADRNVISFRPQRILYSAAVIHTTNSCSATDKIS